MSNSNTDSSNLPVGSEGASLPCLNRHISIENSFSIRNLSTRHKKTAFILKESIQQLANKFGVEYLGFLTLTFKDHVVCPKEAQRRFNSLVSNVIKNRYREYIGVFERQKSGRIHYHLLVVMQDDIKTGIDFFEIRKCNYKSAGKYLRDEWLFWRKTAFKYRFGRTELLPVKSNADAIAKYVGKYISKHLDNRLDEDKGVRLVRYSKGARIGTTRFMFNSDNSNEWRRKVSIFAEIVRSRHPEETIESPKDLSRVIGKKWAYRNWDFIISLP